MLGFVQTWFAPGANPIGVDFGTDCLRMAQVELAATGEYRLVAAASADVPSNVRNDPAARLAFFVEAVRDLLSHGSFRGRRAILTLPAASMFIQHLRMPRMDDAALRKALPWEAQGKLPIDPSHALLRHLVAGEVYHDQEPRDEVVLMAARRELVDQLLAAAARARMDVIGMNVEPKAIVDCFAHVYRRKTDSEVTNCFVDIGCSATRAVIARGTRILFARVIPVGGDHFSGAVASALGIGLEDARLLRVKTCHVQAGEEEAQRQPLRAATAPEGRTTPDDSQMEAEPAGESFALLNAGLRAAQSVNANRATGGAGVATLDRPEAELAPAPAAESRPGDDVHRERERVVAATREPLAKLVEELALCRRYHETTFPNHPVSRLIFVGGEARQRSLCQQIARDLGLAAQVGDPLVRMGRISDIGIESGIDRRLPQPAWAVAVGLSMGPATTGPAEQGNGR